MEIGHLKRLSLFFILILSSTVGQTKCNFITSPKDIKINWEAFKTPAKQSVKGSFKNIGISKARKAKTLKQLLDNANVKIDPSSVFTANTARDKKIFKFFFETIEAKTIEAKIQSVDMKKKALQLLVNMNGQQLTIPMSFKISKSSITASATIDLFDFKLQPQLTAINQACIEKHEGKTWNDVNISFRLKYKKKCP